jgi:hypothetical protein
MQDNDNDIPASPLDDAQIDYIDPLELTDTSEIALPEPVTERIARVLGDSIATVSEEAHQWVEDHKSDND